MAKLGLHPNSLAPKSAFSTTLLYCMFNGHHSRITHSLSKLITMYQCAMTLHLWTMAYRVNSQFITWESWLLLSWCRFPLQTQLLMSPFSVCFSQPPHGRRSYVYLTLAPHEGLWKRWVDTPKVCFSLLFWHTLCVTHFNDFLFSTILCSPSHSLRSNSNVTSSGKVPRFSLTTLVLPTSSVFPQYLGDGSHPDVWIP